MVPVLSIVFMVVSAVISIGLPVVLFLALRKRYQLKVVPMLVGAAAFILFALILEQIMHGLVLRPDAGGAIALRVTNPMLYVLYGIFAAGIFEETARFLSFSWLKKKYHGIGTALSYGIGHGGIEAILLAGLTMISNLMISIMINTGAAQVLESMGNIRLAELTDANSFLFLAGGFERIAAVAVHMSLSLLVWFAVTKKGKWWLYPTAIVLHALVNLAPMLAQVGVIQSILLVEILVYVAAAALVAGAIFVCKTIKKSELRLTQES